MASKSKGKASLHTDAKKVVSGLKAAEKQLQKDVKDKMRSVRQYLYVTIKNSFKKTPKGRKKVPPLYIFDSEGRRICMVSDFLRGAYRAFGHGSYRKEKVQTRYKGTDPPGTYAEKNQRPGEFFTKGTGKFDDEERDAIENRRNPGAPQRKIAREIAKKQKDLERIEGLQSWSEEDKKASESLKKELKGLKKRRGALENGTAPKKYRIVAHDQHDVPARDVLTHVQIVPHSKPGEVPFSNSQKGSPLRKGIYYKDFPEGFQLFAVSLYGDKVYKTLEFGGKSLAGGKFGELLGYTLGNVSEKSSSGRKFSHKRVSLRRKFDGEKKQIETEPRPFFEPAKRKAIEKIQDIFGDEAARYAGKVKFF